MLGDQAVLVATSSGAAVAIVVAFVAFWMIVAGLIGYSLGKRNTGSGCLPLIVVFLVFNILGVVAYMVGQMIGANALKKRTSLMYDPDRFPDASYSAVDPWATPAALPQSGVAARPIGWTPDPQNPSVQRYWDGSNWSGQIHWNGSEWVPF